MTADLSTATPPTARQSSPRWPLAAIGWCVAFGVALAVDVPVARWVRASGTAAAVRGRWWADDIVKVPGNGWFAAAVVALLWAARRINWRQAVFVVIVVAVSGLNGLVKWVVGRTRPFRLPASVGPQPRPLYLQPFWHGIYGFFHQVDLSFPSGHECTASALAVAVLVVYRPVGWALAGLAVVVGIERVAEDAHYVSDVVGAVGLSATGAALAWLALARWIGSSEPGPPGRR